MAPLTHTITVENKLPIVFKLDPTSDISEGWKSAPPQEIAAEAKDVKLVFEGSKSGTLKYNAASSDTGFIVDFSCGVEDDNSVTPSCDEEYDVQVGKYSKDAAKPMEVTLVIAKGEDA